MPRQKKVSLDYFYLDCDIFSKTSDLRPLLRKFKADGLAVFIHILCDVYGTGYYFKPDDYEGYLLDIAEDCGISVEKVQLILAFMADRTLLNAFSLNKNTVFTSHGIQKHYAEAMKGRKRSVAEIKGEYWLLSEKEEAEIDTFYKSHSYGDKSEINSNKSEKNDDKSEIYGTKEIKENKRKMPQESKKEINKEQSSMEEPPMREDGTYDLDYWDRHRSHKSIMDEMFVTGYYRKKLEDFLRYCYANGHTVMNDKLIDIIIRLQESYEDDDTEKIKSLERAMSGGYYDVKEGRV